jgi:Bacterial SH3 domain
MLSLEEVPMSQFHDTELQQSEIVADLVVSVEKPTGDAVGRVDRGTGNPISARATVLTVVAIGILSIPVITLLAKREHLLPRLPVFIGLQSNAVSTGSAVLAVDTFGLTIRVKNASALTRELFEQAAVQHLARLHRTYSRWADSNHDLMGSLLLKLTVDARGTVVSVDPLTSQVTSDSFTKTVMDDVRKWKFPKAGVETAEITVPLLFVPKGMDPDTVVEWERKVRSAQEGETTLSDLRAATKTAISTASEHSRQPAPSVSGSDQTNTTKAPSIHLVQSKTEEKVLIAVKTNRPVAIRENPQFSAKTVHEIDVDTPLRILENRGDWLKVRIADAGFTGFVRKEFVSPMN